MKKRILSFLIALSILLSAGLPVFAAGGLTATAASTSSPSGSSSSGSSSEAERKMPTSPTKDAVVVDGQVGFTIWTYNGEKLVEGKDYSYDDSNNVLTILSDTPIAIQNTVLFGTTDSRIVVAKDVDANITLCRIDIDRSESADNCAFEIEADSKGSVTLTLADGKKNTLKSGENRAGIEKEGTLGSLTIRCEHSGESGHVCDADCGTLEASSYIFTSQAYGNGAGIGSRYAASGNSAAVSNITIAGGNVTATGKGGAAIGSGSAQSGDSGAVSNIKIAGGNVIASGTSGAGIGSGSAQSGNSGDVSNITISGGNVTLSYSSSAGIGSGSAQSDNSGAVSDITITGGNVTAYTSGRYGVGIGAGNASSTKGDTSNVVISGGSLKITGSGKKIGCTPKDANGNELVLYEIVNSGMTLVVGGTLYSGSHTYYDATEQKWVTENKIYTYVPRRDLTIYAGGVKYVYKWDSSLETFDYPAASQEAVGIGDAFDISATNEDDTLVHGTDYLYYEGSGVLFILSDKPMTVKNKTSSSATDRIVVVKDVDANITLAGVNINVSNTAANCAFEIQADSKGSVTLTLADGKKNTLKSGMNRAAIEKDGTLGSLTIRCEHSGESSHVCDTDCGKLEANNDYGSGAGIGSGYAQYGNSGAVSDITIRGGNITATSENGAGIGSGNAATGNSGAVSNITITGGNVTADGRNGAAIGSGYAQNGYSGAVSNITITGGYIALKSVSFAATIGSGRADSGKSGDVSDITIRGGNITAINTGTAPAIGSGRADSGKSGDVSDIRITGGNVTAINNQNNHNYVGIGSVGFDSSPTAAGEVKDIIISGGSVRVSGKGCAIGIGFVRSGSPTSDINPTPVTPKDGNGNNVYLFKLEGLTVGNRMLINDALYTFGHTYYDHEATANNKWKNEAALYLYLPGENFTVYDGTSMQKTECTFSSADNGFTFGTPSSVTAGDKLTVSGVTETAIHGTDYLYDGAAGVLYILSDKPMEIKNTNGASFSVKHRIVVAKDVDANITLAGVNIGVSSDEDNCAFEIVKDSKGSVTLTLADGTSNTLMSGEYRAGIEKEGTLGSLTIQCAHSGESGHACGDSCGKLEAFSGSIPGMSMRPGKGAGIGGAYINTSSGNSADVANITILGGRITAFTGQGVAIGSGGARGGNSGDVSNITIAGGIFTADTNLTVEINGGSYDYMSGCSRGVVTNVVISGGSVKVDGIGCQPTDGKGNNVYLHEIDTTEKSAVVINGVSYPTKHGDENKIYVYLPVGFSVINDGNTSQTVLVKSNGDIVTDPTPTSETEGAFRVWCDDDAAYVIDLDGNLTINKDCYIRVANYNPSKSTNKYIKITDDCNEVNLTLAGVNIDFGYEPPIAIEAKTNSDHTITLEAGTTNTLKANNDGPGLKVAVADDKDTDTSLTFRGTGTLNVSGIEGGILATGQKLSASLYFESGNITATVIKGESGAGIGTNTGRPSEIVISGGNIAASGTTGAGIGIGCDSSIQNSVANITITGGEITASSIFGAGIGIPYQSTNNTVERITITGGKVTATSTSGAAIGNGHLSSASTIGEIAITGGTVKATSTNGAGIGDGESATGASIGSITITGGTVTAKSGCGSGIGGGIYARGTTPATIGAVTVDGGSVLAKSDQNAVAPIGYGVFNENVQDAIMPRNAAGKKVYLITVANPSGEAVTINGTAWTPVNHTAVDSSDTNLYAYIPEMQTALITCGNTSTKLFFVGTGFTADAPVELYDADGVKVDGYATVQEAVNAALDGYTVKLMKDIEIDTIIKIEGKKLTIDLYGQKLMSKSGFSDNAFSINNAELIIRDSSVDESGKIDMIGVPVFIKDGSRFTLESGTLDRHRLPSSSNNVVINTNDQKSNNSTVTLKGGTVNGDIWIKGSTMLYANGGTVNGNIEISPNGKLYANGGTVNGDVNGSGTIDRSSNGTTIDTYTKFFSGTIDDTIKIENEAYPYEITFSNGSGTSKSQLLRGQTLVAPTNFIPEGEILIGWYDGTTKVDLATYLSGGTNGTERAPGRSYQLTAKFVSTEIDSLNQAIKDLETAKNELNNALANKADASELESKINDVNDAITDLRTELAGKASATDLNTLKTTVEGLDNAVQALQSAQSSYATTTAMNTAIETAINTATSTLNTTIGELTGRLTAAESKLNNLTTKADTTADELAEAIRDLSALTTTLNTVKGALENKDTELSGKINDINTALTTAESTLNSAINSLTTRMTAAEKKVNDLTSSKADKSALTAAINELADLTTTLNTLKGTLNTKDSDLEAKIASAETTLKTAIDKVADDLTAAKDELTAAIANKADASTLNKAIDELNKAIANAEAVSKVYADEKDAALKAELTAAINTAKSAFEASLEAAQKNLDDAKSALDKAIKDGDKELADKITALDQAIKALETVAGNNTSADDKIRAELRSEIDAAKTALNEAIGALSERVKDAESDIEALKKEILTVVIVMTSLFVLSAAGTVTLTVLLKRKKIF